MLSERTKMIERYVAKQDAAKQRLLQLEADRKRIAAKEEQARQLIVTCDAKIAALQAEEKK